MSDSTNKIITLILVVIVIFALIGMFRISLFPFFPLSGFFNTLFSPVRNFISTGVFISPKAHPFVPAFSMFLLILWLLVVFWTYKDAEKRGMNGLLWALLVFFGTFIGFLVYLLVRSELKTSAPASYREQQVATGMTCPGCGKPVEPEFAVCPYCKRVLKPVCPSCGKDIKSDWQVCPYCKTDLKQDS